MKRAQQQPDIEREAWRSFDLEEKEGLDKKKQQQQTTTHIMKEDDGASWVTRCQLPAESLITTSDVITKLWALRPTEHSIIKIAGKPVTVPRYNQSYGKAYTFSGATHDAQELPLLLQPYLDFANQRCATMLKRDYGGRQFNMTFVNWYEDGHHYIGWHGDDEKQLYKNQWGETLVFSISLGQQRRFLMRPKPPPRNKDASKKRRASGPKPLCFDLESGDCLVMGGLCQSHYQHSVPKEETKVLGGRINMTFRIFK